MNSLDKSIYIYLCTMSKGLLNNVKEIFLSHLILHIMKKEFYIILYLYYSFQKI